ncbi:Uncharacterized protein Adt_09871 [Abeliophyllum distichum]|uniref:Uncharacterized protein n=1 Tax=Abeliophyllum distichum TaxID=126358 RepID=A0ABD1UIF8_9LAMI
MKDNRIMKMAVKSPPAAVAAVAELLLSVADCLAIDSQLFAGCQSPYCSYFYMGKNVVGTSGNLEEPSYSLLEESTSGLQEIKVAVVQQPPKSPLCFRTLGD